MRDTDELDYYPLSKGVLPASSVRMEKMSNLLPEYKDIFQIDSHYKWFISNKEQARKERLSKYYQTNRAVDKTPVIKFIIQHLTSEYPHMFKWHDDINKLWCSERLQFIEFDEEYNFIGAEDLFGNEAEYADSFDALAMQVPEDMVICTLGADGRDFVSTAHLCSPAGWGAEWAFGKSFAQIHDNVKKADDTHVIKNPTGMVKGIIRMPETVQRVGAISFRSDVVLNLHPEEWVENKWTWDNEQEVYVRFERQTVTPFPEMNSFFFTIKPYWSNLLHPKRIDAAIQALQNVNPNAYHRNFAEKHGAQLLSFLKKKQESYSKLQR